jgi:hypothetical protein
LRCTRGHGERIVEREREGRRRLMHQKEYIETKRAHQPVAQETLAWPFDSIHLWQASTAIEIPATPNPHVRRCSSTQTLPRSRTGGLGRRDQEPTYRRDSKCEGWTAR